MFLENGCSLLVSLSASMSGKTELSIPKKEERNLDKKLLIYAKLKYLLDQLKK
jgi:hypothetical protein